jgi:hypothetical protein
MKATFRYRRSPMKMLTAVIAGLTITLMAQIGQAYVIPGPDVPDDEQTDEIVVPDPPRM